MSKYNQKTIIKNTIFLYLRMFIVLGVSLFTSRVILDKLGVEDYGIYNIVGSIVVSFTFIKSALNSANQRYYSYALGKNENCSRYFSMSINIQWIMLGVLVLLLETIGAYFFNHVIEIPDGRREAASIVYQFSVLTFILHFIQAPYNALIIAYEKMGVYAVFSIVDVILKLLIVYALVFSSSDKLILYAFLMMAVSFVNLMMYMVACRILVKEVRFSFIWDKKLLKEMFGFSTWNLVGGVAGIATHEGPSYIINIFHGVSLNASLGLAKQVNGVVYGFSENFQTAFRPQITKLYASGDFDNLYKLIFRASKSSFFLMYVIALTVVCSQDIFQLWLKTVPDYTRLFCTLYIINQLICSITSPMWMAAHAIGNIRNYQLTLAIMNVLVLPFGILSQIVGLHPSFVIISLLMVNIMIMLYRVMYLKRKMEFPALLFLKEVIVRNVFLLPLLTAPVVYYIGTFLTGLWGLIVLGLFSVTLVCTCFYALCLSKAEKDYVRGIIKDKLPNLKS